MELPYEIHSRILEYLSSKEIEALIKTNTFYEKMWSVLNNSISDKTIYDSKIDEYNIEKIKKYRNIREIIIRTMISCNKNRYREYVDFVSNQKHLRRLQMTFVTEFSSIINIPTGVKWECLTHLNLSFLTERHDTDRDIAYLFLQRAKGLEVFIYENGHLSEPSLTALIQMKSIYTIQWTNVLIYNPFLFKQFLSMATSLRKLHIYYFGFSHVNLTMAIIEAIIVKLHVSNTFKELKFYFEQSEHTYREPAAYRFQDTQFIDTECDDFIGIANLVIPLLRRETMNRFKFTYMHKKILQDNIINDGILTYSVVDPYQHRIRRFCFNIN